MIRVAMIVNTHARKKQVWGKVVLKRVVVALSRIGKVKK